MNNEMSISRMRFFCLFLWLSIIVRVLKMTNFDNVMQSSPNLNSSLNIFFFVSIFGVVRWLSSFVSYMEYVYTYNYCHKVLIDAVFSSNQRKKRKEIHKHTRN